MLDNGVDLSKEGDSRSTGIENGFCSTVGKTVLWSSAGKEVFSLLDCQEVFLLFGGEEFCCWLPSESRLAARAARLGFAGMAGLRGERGLEEELPEGELAAAISAFFCGELAVKFSASLLL